jgi:hypothetical protein
MGVSHDPSNSPDNRQRHHPSIKGRRPAFQVACAGWIPANRTPLPSIGGSSSGASVMIIWIEYLSAILCAGIVGIVLTLTVMS